MNKRNIYLLYAIGLLQGMVFYAPVAALYRQAAGISVFQISLIESISLFLTIVLELPWGWAADRIGYRRTMIVCCSLYFLSKILFWQANSFGDFLLERILLSIVCAGLSGVDSSMLYLSCTGQNTHRVFSVYQNLQETGLVLAAGIYALWVGSNYRLAALLTVISYGVSALLALGLREVKPPEKELRADLRGLFTLLGEQLHSRKLLLLILAAALVNETHQAITVFFSQLQYIRAGMGHGAISAAYIAVSIMGLAGGLSAAFCARTGEKALGSGLIFISFLSCLVLAVTVQPLLCVLAVICLRGCFSLFQPLYLELQNRMVHTHQRATALSINAVVHDGLGIFLNLVLGAAANSSLAGAMALGAALCLVSLCLFRISQAIAE